MGSYSPPVITSSGLSIPTYTEIYNYLVQQFQSIYGTTVNLDNSTADAQWIAIIALALSDAMQGLQYEYTNRAPQTAIGAALDSIVKFNGITRKQASYSTCQVTLFGTPGTVITSGQLTDTLFQYTWDLPASVTIPTGGSIIATATCETIGAVNIPASMSAGQYFQIATPTNGWSNTTTNQASAPGQPVETDAQLRARQALSVALPSLTVLAGTVAAIAAVEGVTRYYVEENPTSSVDANGCPPHSITAIVEGGDNTAIATAIFNNRGIGCYTNSPTGSTPPGEQIPITDPNTGITLVIGFTLPTYVPIYVIVNAHLLPGGTNNTLTLMQTAVVNYLNSLQIGELVSYGALVAEAMSVNSNLSQPIVSVHSLFFGTTSSPSGTTDVVVTFDQVAQGLTANVTVNSI